MSSSTDAPVLAAVINWNGWRDTTECLRSMFALVGIIIAMLTQNLWFILFFIVAYWLYYERIMIAEEQFLTKKFGDRYTGWASVTPAFVFNFKLWKKNEIPFSLKKEVVKPLSFFLFATPLSLKKVKASAKSSSRRSDPGAAWTARA